MGAEQVTLPCTFSGKGCIHCGATSLTNEDGEVCQGWITTTTQDEGCRGCHDVRHLLELIKLAESHILTLTRLAADAVVRMDDITKLFSEVKSDVLQKMQSKGDPDV